MSVLHTQKSGYRDEGNVVDDINPNDSVANKNGNVVDDINPNDSVSNISKHSSHRSRNSTRSSTASSAAIKAEAEKAALVALAAALKEKHALEEQEQQLKRKREQLDLEAEIAASTAKLAVLQASERRGSSQAHSNGMNSYLEKEKKKKLEKAGKICQRVKPYGKDVPSCCMEINTTKGIVRMVTTTQQNPIKGCATQGN